MLVKRMMIMLIGLGALFGMLFGFQVFKERLIKQVLDEYLSAPVTVSATEAAGRTWKSSLNAVGDLSALQGVDVAAEVPGLVDSIHFESGQAVKAGDLLIQQDDDVERGNLESAQAQVVLAKATDRRNRDLLARKMVSQSHVDQGTAALREAEASVSRTMGLIEEKKIRAPFTGKLGIREVDVGQYLGPGSVVVNLQTVAPILVDFALPARELRKVALGQTLSISVDAYPGERFTGKVTALAASIDPQTRTLTVQGSLPNADHRLYPGMFASVQLDLPEEQQLVTVPQTAVASALYGDSVFVVEPDPNPPVPKTEDKGDKKTGNKTDAVDSEPLFIVKQRYVKLGEQRGSEVAVVSGLEAGERVVTSGQLKLKNGARVRIGDGAALATATPRAGG